MTGRMLRQAEQPHECAPPTYADRGDVWACDCGRRWTCVSRDTVRGNIVTVQADWRRRWWPWPRIPAQPRRGHTFGGAASGTPRPPTGSAGIGDLERHRRRLS